MVRGGGQGPKPPPLSYALVTPHFCSPRVGIFAFTKGTFYNQTQNLYYCYFYTSSTFIHFLFLLSFLKNLHLQKWKYIRKYCILKDDHLLKWRMSLKMCCIEMTIILYFISSLLPTSMLSWWFVIFLFGNCTILWISNIF